MASTLTLSKSALNKGLFHFEVSWDEVTGWQTYNNKYSSPVVPDPKNTDSGVTVGIGFDCGYNTAAEIRAAWGSVLPEPQVNALVACARLKKWDADTAAKKLKWIKIPIEAALQVFYNTTLYRFARLAASTYPGLERLHPVEQSVIIGLVYVRGSALEGERRKEMKELVRAVASDDDKFMATLIRSMKRIWPNTKGLRRRMDVYAALIELADTPIPESDKLVIVV